ncbi:MAG: hypothetical protein LBH05_03800 [Deferribacteraceae bacterium]|nr:hypothetical protein [Deferribacteraceae bacterium]
MLILFFGVTPVTAQTVKSPEEILAVFLGIPYRVDGCVDGQGRYTLFTGYDKFFSTPGLNCSGFVLEASRILLKRNIPLSVAINDRLGDSGPGAPLGQDWDFGWDMILNISEGLERVLLLPGNVRADPAAGSGLAPLGFDLHAPETWRELPDRIRSNHLYLVSFSKTSGQRGSSSLKHYHVALLIRISEKDWYIYNTTQKRGKVYRENLGSVQGRNRFLNAYANTGNARKHIFIIELPL